MSYTNGLNGLGTVTGAIETTENVKVQGKGAAVSGSPQQVSNTNVQHADQAQLSTAAGSIAQVLGTSDVRTDKVQALQQAIASGSYNVPSSAVADKMIESMLD
jgi:negative regulator of flagellin synthesis FlgM